jgi:hypothetical protein
VTGMLWAVVSARVEIKPAPLTRSTSVISFKECDIRHVIEIRGSVTARVAGTAAPVQERVDVLHRDPRHQAAAGVPEPAGTSATSRTMQSPHPVFNETSKLIWSAIGAEGIVSEERLS